MKSVTMNYHQGMMIFENDIYCFNERRDQLISVTADSKSVDGEWSLDLKDLDEQADRQPGWCAGIIGTLKTKAVYPGKKRIEKVWKALVEIVQKG